MIVNVLSVVLGGFLENRLPERPKRDLTIMLGLCALAMGISSVVLMMPVSALWMNVVLPLMA